MNRIWRLTIFVLLLVAVGVWAATLTAKSKKFMLVACDVGQGDAILAVWGNFQILTDGGPPNGKVLDCLSKYMPFWDRQLEVVVNTHPQLDHYGGLIDVFKRYKVKYFVANAFRSSASEYRVLINEVGSGRARVINPSKGTTIRFGLISYDIFWPSSSFLLSEGYDGVDGKLGTFSSGRDPNDFSIQALLSFGKFTALLTGDIGSEMKDFLIPNIPPKSVNYIKIPHHGSKNGLTAYYLDIFAPKAAVISVGAKNNYGHPNEEIINLLDKMKVDILRTDLAGDVVIESDGESWSYKNK